MCFVFCPGRGGELRREIDQQTWHESSEHRHRKGRPSCGTRVDMRVGGWQGRSAWGVKSAR
jgi:hypothetical protein